MARIFRQQYTKPDPERPGKRVTRASKKWYVEYADAAGAMRRVPGFRDRKATEHLAAELEAEAERVRAGLLPADVGQARRPLADHLDRYLAAMRARPSGEKHCRTQRQRIDAVIAGCGWGRWADARTADVLVWLDGRRRPAAEGGAGLGLESCNHYKRAVKGFFRWLALEYFSGINPLASLRTANADGDRRRSRRALADGEFTRLLAAARRSRDTLRGLTGPQRATLYVVAAYTGLRSSELYSLTAESLQLGTQPPSLTVQARHSKRRRLDQQPMRADLAGLLAAYLEGRAAGERLWPGDWSPYRGAEILRHDLADAGIPFLDAAGQRFDFHSLRGQYITGLANAGVDMVTAQKLARLSDPRLLARHYARPGLSDLARSVDKLPAIGGNGKPGKPRAKRK